MPFALPAWPLPQEENALLAYHDARDAEDDAAPTTPVTPVTPGSRSSRSSPGRRSAVRSVARRTARQVHLQAKETRQCEAKLTSLRRRTRVNEWYLSQLKVQLQETAKLMQMREHRLQDLRQRFDQAGEERQRLAQEHVRTQQMVDTERQELMQLHQEALILREACYLPAQLKKKSGMLTKFLDQEMSWARGICFWRFFVEELEGPFKKHFDDSAQHKAQSILVYEILTDLLDPWGRFHFFDMRLPMMELAVTKEGNI